MPNFYEVVVNEQKTRKKAEMQENRTICYQSAIAYEKVHGGGKRTTVVLPNKIVL